MWLSLQMTIFFNLSRLKHLVSFNILRRHHDSVGDSVAISITCGVHCADI